MNVVDVQMYGIIQMKLKSISSLVLIMANTRIGLRVSDVMQKARPKCREIERVL